MLSKILIIVAGIIATLLIEFVCLWFYEEIINGGSYSPRG